MRPKTRRRVGNFAAADLTNVVRTSIRSCNVSVPANEREEECASGKTEKNANKISRTLDFHKE